MNQRQWFGPGLLVVIGLALGGPSRSDAAPYVFQSNLFINRYNVVVSENLSGQSHIDYNAFVGGNLTTSGGGGNVDISLKPYLAPGDPDSDIGLTVVGDVVAQNAGTFKVLNGKTALVGGTISPSNALTASSIATGVSGLDALKTSIFAELTTQSNQYANLIANSNATATGNQLNFVAMPSGPDNLAVFNINASVLEDPAVAQLNLTTNGASSIIINVTGTGSGGTFDFGGRNFVGNWNDTTVRGTTLWNFVDATTMNLNSNWNGALLALNADIHNTSNIDGSVFAKSLYLGGEVHLPFYSGYVPPAVPEPSSIALSLIGGAGLIGLVLRRRLQSRT